MDKLGWITLIILTSLSIFFIYYLTKEETKQQSREVIYLPSSCPRATTTPLLDCLPIDCPAISNEELENELEYCWKQANELTTTYEQEIEECYTNAINDLDINNKLTEEIKTLKEQNQVLDELNNHWYMEWWQANEQLQICLINS